MARNVRTRLLSNVVIAYMLLAFAWWSVLLFTKNQDAFQAKADLNKIVMIADGRVSSEEEFRQTKFYKDLEAKYKRQERMITGEAIFFVISLVIGVWLINQGYHREIAAAQQRRNFLLSITHELKSPIASIKLVLETFQRRQLQPSQTKKLSQNAIREADRLNTLVNDLLLAAKMEAAWEPHLEELSLSATLSDLIDRFRNNHPLVQFDFRQPEEEVLIQADKAGLTSVIVNLLENAVKYAADEPRISVVLHQKDDTVWIAVADNGIGIADKEKSKVFERFYRVGNEDTRQTKGTGLGLYIVREIISAHQGTVTITDNRPKGTIFNITLPISGRE